MKELLAGRAPRADGVLLVLASSLFFSAGTAVVKALGPEVPAWWVAWARSALPVPFLAWALRRQGAAFASPRWPGLILRGLFGSVAMASLFWALPRMPLANAVILGHATPIYAVLWGVLFFAERLDRRDALCLSAAFAGVGCAIKPELSFAALPFLAAFAAGLFSSLAMAAVKSLSTSEPPLRIILYFGLVGTAGFAAPALASGFWPAPGQWAALAAVAACVTWGQVLLTTGIGRAPVSRASAGVLFAFVVNAAVGWLVWGERLEARTWLGCLLITAGLLGLRRDPGSE